MQMEEREIFPLLAKSLTEQDWQVIELECQKSLIDDPLFLDREQKEFEDLRVYLTASD